MVKKKLNYLSEIGEIDAFIKDAIFYLYETGFVNWWCKFFTHITKGYISSFSITKSGFGLHLHHIGDNDSFIVNSIDRLSVVNFSN